MKIEMIKPHKLLQVGQKLDINRGYALNLIKNGLAKEVGAIEEVKKEVEPTAKTEVEKPKIKRK